MRYDFFETREASMLMRRRSFFGKVAGMIGVAASPAFGDSKAAPRIDRRVLFEGRSGGTSWFHPRACVVPSGNSSLVFMTMQSISGSDVFGPVHWTVSKDQGGTWTTPEPIPGLGRKPLEPAWEVGVCDVVPEYHPATKTVLAMGHNVYYKNNVLAKPQRSRWPVHAVWSAEKGWSEPRRLEWDDPRGETIYTCGCSQRVVLPDGDILVPLSIGSPAHPERSIVTARCSFDGRDLKIKEVGPEIVHRVKRGLLEPSLAQVGDRFYVTIRAEDDRGYVSTSADGLKWEPKRAWSWDDGKPVFMSTTQQHWLSRGDRLYLVYTRKTETNARVVRWRAPLFMAEVDRASLRLIRSTEQTLLPLIGDGIKDPKHVALMGNFHPVVIGPNEAWVTVGEERSNDGWHGDTLLARLRW